VADALAKGATLLRGGKRLRGPGNGFEPTVFTDVDNTMVLMRDEASARSSASRRSRATTRR